MQTFYNLIFNCFFLETIGKILFGRSHIERVALKRMSQIDSYCQVGMILLCIIIILY